MENKDVFSIMQVDSKEDVYTFCLTEFMSGSKEYRQKSAASWGFEDGDDYSILRISIADNISELRSKITPDIIMYNSKHIAVIESKMFSAEGNCQTSDYEKAATVIKRAVGCEDADIEYYFFTLAGISAASSKFIIKRWSDYYKETLSDIKFENESLETIRKNILERALEFVAFEVNYRNMQYGQLTDNANCWIGPFALFSSGLLNEEWGYDLENYYIYNGVVRGRGHATFRTDIADKECSWREGKETDDSIYIFSRIEWNKDSVDIFLNYEYWKNDGTDYVPFSHLDKKHQEISIANRNKVCKYLRRIDLPCKAIIPSEKKNMLHMLKVNIGTTEKTIGEVIESIKDVLRLYEKLSADIFMKFKIVDGFYKFQA